jgi:RHS repeat-associated protein
LSAAVSGQNGTFAIPGVPVTGGANALSVTVTDVSGNVATQVVNVTVVNGTTDIGYDGNGNQTNHNGWAMTYDRENRLASASSAALAVSYSYDALGRLIQRVAGNSTNRLYYAGWQLIAEYDGTGALQRKYVYGPGIDEPIRVTANGTNYYYHQDGLGSVTEITDGTGNLVESYRYDVYGTPTILAPDSRLLTTSLIGNRFLFTGRDYDPDTGWYNYRNRYYSPSAGRFVQPDPVRLQGGLNLYAYVGNRPNRTGDPFGLWNLWNPGTWFNGTGWEGFDSLNPLGQSAVWGAFNLEAWQQGAAAALDGIIPFYDPFEIVYKDDCGRFKNGTQWSKGLGQVSQQALLTAGGLGLSKGLNTLLMPKTLYHFTSAASAAGIEATGGIAAGSGFYGTGVYLTGFNSATMATIQGARSTAAAIAVASEGLPVSATYFPGTYIVRGASVLLR